MTLKGNAKFKGKPTCGFKNDIMNLANFRASSQKSENLHFAWILLPKAYKDLCFMTLKTVQSLKKNWLLIPKMTWGIWWIVMQAVASLKIFTLMGYFLSLVCNVWAKEISRGCAMKNDLGFQKWHKSYGEFSHK